MRGAPSPLPTPPNPGRTSLAPPEEDGKGWFATDTMSTVAGRYRAMRDKRRFFDLAVKAGGGSHMAYAALADFRCNEVSRTPGIAEKEGKRLESLDRPTLHDQARARQYDGCEGFAKRPVTEIEMNGLMAEIRGASDPAARAARLLIEMPNDRRFARLEVSALLAEGDLRLAWLLTEPAARLSVTWPHGPSEYRWDGSEAYRAAWASFKAEEAA